MKRFFNEKTYLGDRQTIDIYKNCLSPFFIKYMTNLYKEDGTANNYLYWRFQINLAIQNKNEYKNNIIYKPIIKDIDEFYHQYNKLISEIFKLLFCCYNHDKTEKIGHYKQYLVMALYPIDERLKKIYFLRHRILKYENEGEYKNAKDLQKFIIRKLEFFIEYFEENFCVHLKTTPIDNYINDLKSFFENIINEDKLIKSIEIDKFNLTTPEPQQNENNNTGAKDGLKKNDEVKNNFNDDKIENLTNYFKINLVDKGYLTNENFKLFIKNAIELNKPLTDKIRLEKATTIQNIRKIFYGYYKSQINDKHNNQDKYIKLLTDYFYGYDFEKIKNNFNK